MSLGIVFGGTLVASTLAYLAATNKTRIGAATLLTTLLDFADVGDISVFIDEPQLQLADEHMQRLGYLEGHHMATAFNLMRENDLIWFFVVNKYLLGRGPAPFDILYWNSDTTRMPATMQSYYLRNMYHRNVLKNAGGDYARKRTHRSTEDRYSSLFLVDTRRSYCPVAFNICGNTVGLRSGSFCAWCIRPRRRRD